ncbi:aldehyde dehydrogenase family protein [Patescibacteria group bacterium]|nr:aldehyde dehydrogenase family protein [Patescibacteria group bacterium]MBU1015545.1 aldehyde dehydrogenase family protein [Patescibacteria group bacterium]MBU1685596.1 aldehyde dehydrogenase family protein [Patescibacteria group bacterium]MBU1938986.1 aldehyde dehydrogenase family protein [Patescibacteria group bacterium]
MHSYKNLINGKWVEEGCGGSFEVCNPYTEEVIGTVPKLDIDTIEKAIKTASAYHPQLTAYERYEILRGTAEEVQERREELSHLISSESGICLKSTYHEVERANQALLFCAEEARRLEGQSFPGDIIPGVRNKIGMTIYQPVGLVLAITPFNHPLNQVVHKIGPSIAAGNTTVLKPSEKTPLTAIRFAEILLNNGLPPQMLSVLTCDINKTTDRLLRNPHFDMVTFTGSTQVGEYIHERIGVKKTLLELGGNSAFIVMDDADVDKAIDISVKGAFANSGQRCTSIKRLLVHEEVADRFIPRFVDSAMQLKCGDPFDEATDVGTVIDEEAAKRIERVVGLAIQDGAKLLYGGERNKALYTPTVLDEVDPGSEIVTEETFGPTAPIVRFKTLEEAIQITNSTRYGLQAGICTCNINVAFKAAREIRTGAVIINEGPGFRIESFPFGGIKKSGIGREGISFAVREMSHLKLIVI